MHKLPERTRTLSFDSPSTSEQDCSRQQSDVISKGRLTLCVVGSGGVGKSSLTIRYLQGHFPEVYDPTVEESYITKIEYGFDLHDVEVIDTAGQEEFLSFRDSSLSKGDGFLALFAINSVASWYDLQELRTKIVRDNDDDESVPMVIIANKSDLDDSRQVNFDEVLEYCQQHSCPLLETSAKTGLNVTESFRLLLDRVAELKPLKFKNSILCPISVQHTNDSKQKHSCIIL